MGKRKVLNDLTTSQNCTFIPNKKPSFLITDLKMVPIVSDDENSNGTAPSPVKSTDKDMCLDVKLEVRQVEAPPSSHTETRGPALITLHLPTAMWCSGINLVPEAELSVGLPDASCGFDKRFSRDPEFVSFQVESMYSLFFEAEKKLQINSCYMDRQINFTEKDRSKMVNCMVGERFPAFPANLTASLPFLSSDELRPFTGALPKHAVPSSARYGLVYGAPRKR
jgi:hypothetical protein